MATSSLTIDPIIESHVWTSFNAPASHQNLTHKAFSSFIYSILEYFGNKFNPKAFSPSVFIHQGNHKIPIGLKPGTQLNN